MENSNEKFLEFNGNILLFVCINGNNWVAIKPICQALNVDYSAQYRRLKRDPILASAYGVHPIQVPNEQLRTFACVPELYVYGFIFGIASKSETLTEYKKQCYKLLFDHFHGVITGRNKLLKSKALLRKEKAELEVALSENKQFVRYQQLPKEQNRNKQELIQLDERGVKSQLEIFNEN